jgi:diguanylate cyclase (GGDEF)-like protein
MTPANLLVLSERPESLPAVRAALDAEQRAGTTAFRLLEPSLSLREGPQRLAAGDVDVLIVDAAGVPDLALEVIVRGRVEAPRVPVLLLTDSSDAQSSLDLRAIALGAQDVLTREQLGPGMLARVLHYAMERQRMQETMQRLALSDPLTGLYSRRGFTALLEHHIKLASRTRGLLIAIADVDRPPDAVAERSRAHDDQALLGAVEVLQATFRASDVIARLDGHTFAILVLDAASDAADHIAARLRANLDRHNAAHPAARALSLSLRVTRVDLEAGLSAEDVMERARG